MITEHYTLYFSVQGRTNKCVIKVLQVKIKTQKSEVIFV